MLPPRNLDQQVASGLVSWFQQNTVITDQIPAIMMFDYYRRDLPASSNMMLLVYPLNYDESIPLYHYGWLKLDFVFSTYWMREDKTIQALGIQSTVVSQIKQSANADLISFMEQYIGGLQNLGLINMGDYSKLYIYDNQQTTSKIEVKFKYRINWQLYQEWLQSYQCDIESPNIPIYNYLEEYKLTTTPLP